MKITEQVIRHLTLEEGNYKISMTIADDDYIRMETYKEDRKFVFDNLYCEETLDKWEGVLKLMIKTIKIAREKLEALITNEKKLNL